MKGLSITGFIISILIFLLAMYLQFVVVPAVASLERMIDYNEPEVSYVLAVIINTMLKFFTHISRTI